MRFLPLFFLLFFLVACDGGNSGVQAELGPRDKTKEAQPNLVKMKEASKKFWAKNKAAPTEVPDLVEFGITEKLLSGANYSDIGYGFGELTFDDKGKLTNGFYWANSKTGGDSVRLDGVTGEFDYVPSKTDFPSLHKDSEGETDENVPESE
ncbi:MAG: hypothetical protein V3V10_07280 [Planctomycetota bacterium]